MNDINIWGFPKGNVAKTLRTILYPNLDDSEVEVIVVCLLSHLLIENTMNTLLYQWLIYDAPKPAEPDSVEKLQDKLWTQITRMGFAAKYSLLEPFFAASFPQEAAEIRKINELRNAICHGRAIKSAQFKGRPISDEKTVQDIFLCAQFTSRQLGKFGELLDNRRALAERWGKRLRELGEPLV